jgi:periplasmic divalent cation tolerance protein
LRDMAASAERSAPVDFISVTTTTDNEASAQSIARALLEARLAACVQISSPIESGYCWEGKIETSREWRLTIKTSAKLFPQVEAAIRQAHPYSTPQILAIPIIAGNQDYLGWLRESLRAPT